MFYKFFNNSKPGTILLLLLITVTISVASNIFFVRNNIETSFLIRLGQLRLPSSFSLILASVFILTISIIYQFLLRKYNVLRDNSFALFFFTIMLGVDQKLFLLNDILISYLFIVFAIGNLLSLNENTNIGPRLFNAGFFIGLASLIYPHMFLYTVLIYVAIIIYGAGGWRNWFVPLLGILIPFYFSFTVYYLLDQTDQYAQYFQSMFEFNLNGISILNNKQQAFSWFIIFALTLWSTKDYTINLRNQKFDTRKAYSLNYTSLLVAIAIIILGDIKDRSEMIIVLFPIAAIWAKYLQHYKKNTWKREIYFYLSMLAVTLSHLLW